MKKYNIFKALTLILLLVLVGWLVWAPFSAVGNYSENVYPFARADAKFDRAKGTNSLLTFADYTEDGLAILERYSGNEDWFFPTDFTNMDLIKLDIQIIINNSRLAANITTYGSDAYQETLDNAKESLGVQTERLGNVELLYLGAGKSYIGLIWGWIGILIAILVFMAIFRCLWDYYYNRW